VRRAGRIVVATALLAATTVSVHTFLTATETNDPVLTVLPTLSASPEPTAQPAPTSSASTPPPRTGSPTSAPTATRSGGTPRPTATTTTRPAAPSTGSNGVVPLIRPGAPPPTNGPEGPPAVQASVETDLFPGENGDEADDSAVWRNPADPSRSLVVADFKSGSGGVGVFDLRGRLVSFSRIGKIGNIDLRSGVKVGSRTVTLVGANDRSDGTIRFWSLDGARGALTPLDARPIRTVNPNYGFCMGRSADGAHVYAFVSGEDSSVFEQYELKLTSGKVDAVKVRTLEIGSLSEACVVDDVRNALYVGEEDVGVWRYGLAPGTGAARTSIDRVGNGRITADVEGLAVARGRGGAVLVVSSQGDSTYSVYDLEGRHAFRGSFRIEGSGQVDGTSDTDGIALAGGSFGSAFPDGLLVAHDAKNTGGTTGGDGGGSNLKYVRFDRIFDIGT
jgi:3-phytase